jgi:hypothetical protein
MILSGASQYRNSDEFLHLLEYLLTRLFVLFFLVSLSAGCGSSGALSTTQPASATNLLSDAEIENLLLSDFPSPLDFRSVATGIQNGELEPTSLDTILASDRSGLMSRLSNKDRGFLLKTVQAYLWGYGPMTVYRLNREKTNSLAPINQFFHATHLADWQTPSPVSAPSMDVLYSSAFLDLSPGPLRFTVPALAGYYVVQIDDAYGSSNASIGSRTSPGAAGGDFLIVGPDDPAYTDPSAYEGEGFDEAHIIPMDTNSAWLIVRVPLNPYAVVGAPLDLTASASYQANAQFQLEPLIAAPTPSSFDPAIARKYGRDPIGAREFFEWLGEAMVANPVPTTAAFSNSTLPPYLMSPSPSVGQQDLFDTFAEISLDADGFHPEQLSRRQLALLELGGALGKEVLEAAKTFGTRGSPEQNFWHVSATSAIGKYPNSWSGYLVRSLAGLEGGIASLAADGTYPLTSSATDGTALQAGQAYSLTFPAGYTPPITLPGFWSVTCYGDSSDSTSQANTPAVSQAGVRNTAYSAPPDRPVSVLDTTHFRVLSGSDYSTPNTIYFQDPPVGLLANTPYFVIRHDPVTGVFQLADSWNPRPLEMLPVETAAAAVGETYLSALVTPVHNLGSQQLQPPLGEPALNGETLEFNDDGSLTLYLQNDPPQDPDLWSNWLPIPADGNFQIMMRMYHPAAADPVNNALSILSTTTIPLTTTDANLAAQYPQQPINSSNRHGSYVVPGIVAEATPK